VVFIFYQMNKQSKNLFNTNKINDDDSVRNTSYFNLKTPGVENITMGTPINHDVNSNQQTCSSIASSGVVFMSPPSTDFDVPVEINDPERQSDEGYRNGIKHYYDEDDEDDEERNSNDIILNEENNELTTYSY